MKIVQCSGIDCDVILSCFVIETEFMANHLLSEVNTTKEMDLHINHNLKTTKQTIHRAKDMLPTPPGKCIYRITILTDLDRGP